MEKGKIFERELLPLCSKKEKQKKKKSATQATQGTYTIITFSDKIQ